MTVPHLNTSDRKSTPVYKWGKKENRTSPTLMGEQPRAVEMSTLSKVRAIYVSENLSVGVVDPLHPEYILSPTMTLHVNYLNQTTRICHSFAGSRTLLLYI